MRKDPYLGLEELFVHDTSQRLANWASPGHVISAHIIQTLENVRLHVCIPYD